MLDQVSQAQNTTGFLSYLTSWWHGGYPHYLAFFVNAHSDLCSLRAFPEAAEGPSVSHLEGH